MCYLFGTIGVVDITSGIVQFRRNLPPAPSQQKKSLTRSPRAHSEPHSLT